jgi:hypothetical protein
MGKPLSAGSLHDLTAWCSEPKTRDAFNAATWSLSFSRAWSIPLTLSSSSLPTRVLCAYCHILGAFKHDAVGAMACDPVRAFARL